MTTVSDGLFQYGGMPVGLGFPFNIGNIYYVCQEANSSVYDYMWKKYKDRTYDTDGSKILHTTIQGGLDATVANREDYVIVCTDGSDYDLTAALTMTKKGVHLICPGGFTHGGGMPGNAVRIHQNTAATSCITVTADCVEIAGFFFKGMLDSNIVNLSGSRWHDYIHHNFFGGAVTAGADIFIVGGAADVYQSTISDNYIMGGYSPNAAQTISSCVGFTSASSGRNLIARNYIVSGAKITVTAGIKTAGVTDVVCDNYIIESVDAALGAGTFTESWDGTVSTVYINNRTCMDTAAESGGTASTTHCNNWEATSGNTIIEAS